MIRSSSPQNIRVGAEISVSRFSSRVLPSGQKIRAAASRRGSARSAIPPSWRLRALPSAPPSSPGRRTSARVPGRRAAPRDRSADRLRRTGRRARSARASAPNSGQSAAISAAIEAPTELPTRSAPSSPAARCSPHRQQPVEMRVEHAVAAIAAREARQRRHDHLRVSASRSRKGTQRGRPPKPARKPIGRRCPCARHGSETR